MNPRVLAAVLLLTIPAASQGTITSLAPSSVLAGSATFTLLVNGAGFTSANIIQWDGTNVTTAFVSATRLSASIPASELTAAATHSVRVRQSLLVFSFSNTVSFDVDNPVPVLSSMSPVTSVAGSGDFTLTVAGTNFNASSAVTWNGAALATTFVSTTSLAAGVPATLVAGVGIATIRVNNPAPGGGTSAGQPYAITGNPVPVVTGLSPASVLVGSPSTTLTFTGSGFAASATVKLGGSTIPTTSVTATQLTALAPAALLALTGILTTEVTNPAPGGGAAAGPNLAVNNPVPSLASTSPASVTAGGANITMTCNGTNYHPSSQILWDGVAFATTFVSSTQINMTLSAGLLAAGGTHSVAVRNPLPGGGTSVGLVFNVNSLVPNFLSVSPGNPIAGVSTVLTVSGSNFNAASAMRVNGVAVATTFINGAQLSTVFTTAIAEGGVTSTIDVVSPAPGGGVSPQSGTITVHNPEPVLASISPPTIQALSAPFVITVVGSSFVPTSTVRFNGTPIATSFLASNQLTATIPASSLTAGGAVPLTVSSPAPGGGTTSAQTLAVNNPAPSIASLAPPTATAGAASFALSVNGANFVATSVVTVDGTSVATTFVDSTHLSVTLSGASLAVGGTHAIGVVNPAPGGGSSSPSILTVNNPAPSLNLLSPNPVLAGSGAFTLTLTGAGFNASSQIFVNGASVPAAVSSATQASTTIAASVIASGGTRSIVVINPVPGGGASNTLTLQVNNPLPVVTSISPPQAPAGSGILTLTVNGQGFVPPSTVALDGFPVPTVFVSATELSATIPATTTNSTGTHTIHVTTAPPGGGVGGPQTLAIINPPPVFGAVNPASIVLGSASTLTVTGSGFSPSSVVRVNGINLPTGFVSPSALTATITPVATGSLTIDVLSPPPIGGLSGTGVVQAVNPLPILSALTPATVPVGTASQLLTVTGTSFVATSVITFDQGAIPTTFVSGATLTGSVPAAALTHAGTHAIQVLTPGPNGGTTTALTFDVLNPSPVLLSVSPSLVLVGGPVTAFTLSGAGFVQGSSIEVNGVPQSAAFVSGTELTVTLAASAFTTAGSLALSVVNGAPGGGSSGTIPIIVHNAVPVLTGVAVQAPPFTVDANESLLLSGSGFHPLSVVQIDGLPLSTTFSGSILGAQALSASVPAYFLTAGSHAVSVVNSGDGGGSSAAVSLSAANPVPVMTSLSASPIAGGGSVDLTMAAFGTGFVPATLIDVSGTPVAATFVASGQMSFILPAALKRAPRIYAITATNPGPGGGTSSVPLTVDGPVIRASVPAFIPVLTAASPPVAMTVSGSGLLPGDEIRVNGVALPTGFQSPVVVTCVIDPTVGAALQPGGFALTVVRLGSSGFMTSNALGIGVGSATSPDNEGTVTLGPIPPAPGAGFSVRLETPVSGVPFTLVLESPPPPTLPVQLIPGFDLVLGPGLFAPLTLVDGLGLFGAATPVPTLPYDLTSLGVPAIGGLFEITSFVAPPVAFGITLSIAAVYLHPGSPVGFSATHVSGPYSL